MCNVNVVNKISCFCLIIFFSEGIGVVLASLATPWLCPCIFVPFLFVHLFAIVTFNLGIVYKRMYISSNISTVWLEPYSDFYSPTTITKFLTKASQMGMGVVCDFRHRGIRSIRVRSDGSGWLSKAESEGPNFPAELPSYIRPYTVWPTTIKFDMVTHLREDVFTHQPLPLFRRARTPALPNFWDLHTAYAHTVWSWATKFDTDGMV